MARLPGGRPFAFLFQPDLVSKGHLVVACTHHSTAPDPGRSPWRRWDETSPVKGPAADASPPAPGWPERGLGLKTGQGGRAGRQPFLEVSAPGGCRTRHQSLSWAGCFLPSPARLVDGNELFRRRRERGGCVFSEI